MSEKYPLSEGSLRLIMKGGQIENVIVQVLGSKRIVSGSSDKERYRLLLSDGKYHTSFVMLFTQIDQILKGEVTNNCIIKIKKYITSVINKSGKGHKRVLVILDMETLVPGDKSTRIGDPEQLPEDDGDDAPIDNICNINAAPSNENALMLNNISEDFSYLDIMD